MKRRITAIQPRDRHSSRYLIFLDEEPFHEVEQSLITKFGLRVDMEIEEEALQALIEQDEIPRAKRYAFDLLVRQAYAREEMRQKLRGKGFGEGATASVIETLERLGYIKDEDYAANWVSQRTRNKPRGKHLLRQELLRKGIDKTTIDRVLADIDEEQEFSLAMRAGKRQMAHYRRLDPAVARRRLYGFLQRRGFDADTCRRVVNRLVSHRASPQNRSRGESKHVDS